MMARRIDPALLLFAFLLALGYGISDGWPGAVLLLVGTALGWCGAVQWAALDRHSE